jgi:hypothetical protein
VSGRKRIQARCTGYNKNNGGVYWKTIALSIGWGWVSSRKRTKRLFFTAGMSVKAMGLFGPWDVLLG